MRSLVILLAACASAPAPEPALPSAAAPPAPPPTGPWRARFTRDGSWVDVAAPDRRACVDTLMLIGAAKVVRPCRQASLAPHPASGRAVLVYDYTSLPANATAHLYEATTDLARCEAERQRRFDEDIQGQRALLREEQASATRERDRARDEERRACVSHPTPSDEILCREAGRRRVHHEARIAAVGRAELIPPTPFRCEAR